MTVHEHGSSDVQTIHNVADTKGVDVADVEVNESQTDEGERLVSYVIHTEDGPKGRVTKMPEVQTDGISFRSDVQNTLSQLKKFIAGDLDQPEDDGEAGTERTDSDASERSRSRRRPSPSGDGPGSQLDAEIEAIHDRLDELEARLDEMEEKGEALDGLQQLMNQGDD